MGLNPPHAFPVLSAEYGRTEDEIVDQHSAHIEIGDLPSAGFFAEVLRKAVDDPYARVLFQNGDGLFQVVRPDAVVRIQGEDVFSRCGFDAVVSSGGKALIRRVDYPGFGFFVVFQQIDGKRIRGPVVNHDDFEVFEGLLQNRTDGFVYEGALVVTRDDNADLGGMGAGHLSIVIGHLS